jgi:L-fucose isomerase-like protein
MTDSPFRTRSPKRDWVVLVHMPNSFNPKVYGPCTLEEAEDYQREAQDVWPEASALAYRMIWPKEFFTMARARRALRDET